MWAASLICMQALLSLFAKAANELWSPLWHAPERALAKVHELSNAHFDSLMQRETMADGCPTTSMSEVTCHSEGLEEAEGMCMQPTAQARYTCSGVPYFMVYTLMMSPSALDPPK